MKSMKAVLILLLGILSAKSYAQTFSIIKNRYSNAENSGWALSIKVEYEKGLSKFYSASCYFGDVAKFSDSVRISLIEQLLDGIENDTLVCAKPVEALSYRYGQCLFCNGSIRWTKLISVSWIMSLSANMNFG